jgi:cobalt-zinc-cadmium resistance protein CzcA
LGALDFGMVVDGCVVMVENIVRHLNRKSDTRETPQDKIRSAAHEVQRPVFYAIGIIITAYLPIFTLQSVEGRLFKPMAWTVAFALLGALMFSMIIAPVLASLLFRNGAEEWHNPLMEFLKEAYRKRLYEAIHHRLITVGVGVLGLLLAIFLLYSGFIGSEFLPHLDEGAVYVRGSLAPSTGPDEAFAIESKARLILASFSEVTDVIGQIGRDSSIRNTTSILSLKRNGARSSIETKTN